MHKFEDMDGLIGEAFGGDAPNGSHINVVISKRGSATYATTMRTLSSPSSGHVPFLSCLDLGNLVRPATIVINKITLEDEEYERLFFGATQLGISQGVMDAVEKGLIDKDKTEELALLVACWIDPNANNDKSVRENSREAMFSSIQSAIEKDSSEKVDYLLSIKETATNNFYKE